MAALEKNVKSIREWFTDVKIAAGELVSAIFTEDDIAEDAIDEAIQYTKKSNPELEGLDGYKEIYNLVEKDLSEKEQKLFEEASREEKSKKEQAKLEKKIDEITENEIKTSIENIMKDNQRQPGGEEKELTK